jgi:molybdenum cofactor cytidylyltransferase
MNPVASPRLRIVILAAGLSSRLGFPKALARVRGTSLLRKTLRSTAGLCTGDTIVVVPNRCARWRAEACGSNTAFIVNRQRTQGLSSSVRRGVWSTRYSSALLLLPVDLVDLRRRDLQRLISRWRATPRRVIARRIAATGGTTSGTSGGATGAGEATGGTPLILPRWLYARASRIQGDVGLRELLQHLTAETRLLIDLPSAARDIDTPNDLRAARRRRQLSQTF